MSSKSKLALAAYNLADAKSKLRNIQLDIDNTNIIAPFDGIITEKYVEVSDFVIPGNVLLTIVKLNPIKIQDLANMISEIIGVKKIKFKNKIELGHYKFSPYNVENSSVEKIILPTYVDLGQGISQVASEILKKSK